MRFAGFRRPKRERRVGRGLRNASLPLPLVCWPERPRLHIVSATCWGFRLGTSRLPFRALARKSQHARRSSKGLCTFPLHTPSTAILCPALPQASLVRMSCLSPAASASPRARRLPPCRRCPFLSSRRRRRPRAATPPTTGAPSPCRCPKTALPLCPFPQADARSSATSALACTRSAHLQRHQRTGHLDIVLAADCCPPSLPPPRHPRFHLAAAGSPPSYLVRTHRPFTLGPRPAVLPRDLFPWPWSWAPF